MSEKSAGLRTTTGAAIPLLGVEVTGEVAAGHARVAVRQRYRNDEPRPVEAIYTFPLPADATLIGFTMTCAGRQLHGVVKEREEAFRAYDDAVTAGHGAALLDQERPNVFTASVGNLLPGEETTVEVEYVQRLRADEGTLRCMIPTLVAPRYIPGTPAGDRTAHGVADPTDRVPDADRITPPIGAVAYGLKLDLAFALGGGLLVESPSHDIATEPIDGGVRVRLARDQVALDRDVVLVVRNVDESPVVQTAIHRPAEAGEPAVVALSVVPDLAADGPADRRQEIVFLIDVSGSMDGDSIEQARDALRLCLRHLREGDRFNVIAFQSEHRSFKKEPVPFTQKTLEQADAWVERLRADGGTELLAPLTDAVQQIPAGVIVLLTDGQVGNEVEILREVLHARRGARVYSFGIGTNVSDALLRDLARRTGGAVEFIHPGERIDEKVVAQFARALADRVDDLRLTWEGIDVGEIAPAEIPPLVDGDAWVIYGRTAALASGRAVLQGTLRGQSFRLAVPVDPSSAAQVRALPQLWAAARIQDLQDAKVEGRRAAAMKKRVTELAVKHGIASRYTSFVVVEERTGDRRASGQPETRVVPVNLPAGWAMFERDDTSLPSRTTAGGAPVLYSMAAIMPRAVVSASASFGGSAPRRRGAPGGLVGRIVATAKQMTTKADDLELADLDVGAFDAPAEEEIEFGRAPAAGPGGGALASPRAEIALLGRQRASGLWDADAGAPAIRATSLALLELRRAGIDATHGTHGPQVKKAVAALLDLVRQETAVGTDLLALALAVAWLVAPGRRARRDLKTLVERTPAGAALVPLLDDETALRAHAEALATRA